MKMLKKLALVSAVSMISAGAFAMEAMDDESMASATGQDGITILISPAAVDGASIAGLNQSVTEATLDAIDVGGVVSAATALTDTTKAFKGLSIKQIVIHDNDGWTVAGGGTASTANSGALVIGSGVAADKESTVVFADDTTPIEINIDMVGNHLGGAGGGAMLNVQIKTPKLAIATGAIYVADSYNTGGDGVDDSAATLADAALVGDDTDNVVAKDGNAHRGRIKIMSGLSIVMGASTTNIQLGNESQTLSGAAVSATNPTGMIKIDATLNGGLAINNFELIDAGGGITGGSIKVGQVKVTNAGGTDLDILAVVNVEDDLTALNTNYAGPAATEGGLVVTIGKLGTAAGGADIALNNVVLGSGTAKGLGDVQLLGLNLSGSSLIIRGH